MIGIVCHSPRLVRCARFGTACGTVRFGLPARFSPGALPHGPLQHPAR